MNSEKSSKICAFCDSSNIDLIMDFGTMALAGGFLKKNNFDKEPQFRMRMAFCNDCYAVQIIDSIPPDLMFKDYFYFSSSIETLKNHFKEYANEITERFLDPNHASVLEFGCNDGILLKPFANLGIKTIIGVDPAENVIKTINDERIQTICDYFNKDVSNNVVKNYGKMDVVLANNAFAHIDKIQETTEAVKNVLTDDGIFVFEVHKLGVVIDELQYDMIYHEHIYYYSLLSVINHFKRYSMKVFDIKEIPTHGGSYRFYICNENGKFSNKSTENVQKIINHEKRKGYNKLDTFLEFSNNVQNAKNDLMDLLNKLKLDGKNIVGYGASGRANTMIQYCGIDSNLIDYMVDDSKAKQGFYTPGSHLEIRSNESLYNDPPDYVIVFAWTFFEEIKNKNQEYIKNGGKFIIPLPKVSIYP